MSFSLNLMAPVSRLLSSKPTPVLPRVNLFQTPIQVTRNAFKNDPRQVYLDYLKTATNLSAQDIAHHMEQVDFFLEKGYTWSLQ